MNFNINNLTIQQFITTNLNTDISKIILKGSPFTGVSPQELANQILAKKKCESKLPTWFSTEQIYYPEKISIEQTSSEITANYKASIISGKNIIDITGGFGVDCFYFSKTFDKVTHCEINSELSEIVSHNYKKLNAKNIDTVANDGIKHLQENDFSYDFIYVDPSRRNDKKGKVFLLEDCLPNVPKYLDFLFTKSEQILIKNSPILDITATIKTLKFIKEIHIVAVNNEVKELLFLLKKDFNKPIYIKTINLDKKSNQIFDFEYKNEVNCSFSEPLNFLYEPNAAILKSGGFQHIGIKTNTLKLHTHSHLYTSDNLIDFPGRRFKILNVINYDKKKLKQLILSNKANITVRNFPKTVVQIRKETKLKDGGSSYLFFTKNLNNKNIVIICEKIF